MTREEMIKRIMEFENMMGAYHRHHTRYNSNGLSFFSTLMHTFGTNKQEKIYKTLLEDIKLIYHEVEYEEYLALRNRIITAFET